MRARHVMSASLGLSSWMALPAWAQIDPHTPMVQLGTNAVAAPMASSEPWRGTGEPTALTHVAPAEAPGGPSPAPAVPASNPPPDFGASSLFDPALDTAARGLLLQLYGDTELAAARQDRWRANFAASHLDFFATADVDRLNFLSELIFESNQHDILVELDRLQISWLFSNWLRVRAGRFHAAFGYYGDSYHHGNLFELTTSRPSALTETGLLALHVIGVGAEGTFDAGSIGAFRYDLDLAEGRTAHLDDLPGPYPPDDKLANLRLRWLSPDGWIIGVNALRDASPAFPELRRPHVVELSGGAHVVYLEGNYHILVEAYAVRHAPRGQTAKTTQAGFAELGYRLGRFTPYVRPEWIRFPSGGDVLYQAAESAYAGARHFLDLRLGLRWQPSVELALKAEVQRVTRDAAHDEFVTVKAAFGF